MRLKKPSVQKPGVHTENIYSPMAGRAFVSSFYFGIIAVIILIFFSIGEAKGFAAFCNILGIVIVLAFASLTVGGIIGFLFGIPHTVQQNTLVNTPNTPPVGEGNTGGTTPPVGTTTTSAQTVTATPNVPSLLAKQQAKSNFTPSTNLEQIADWLTKIIVGVGLTEVHAIGNYFNSSCNYLGKTLQHYSATGQNGSLVVGAIIILFSIIGFLLVYLWTYLYLIRIQDSMISASDIIETIDSKMADSDSNDKQATDLAYRQLSLADGAPDIPVADLVNVFQKASRSVLSSIFFRSVAIRKMYWKNADTKFKIEKTIPIFKALIILDSNFEIPENYAELAYVLKDKRTPDYTGALENLNKAIQGISDSNTMIDAGFVYFNRAYCRIKLDPEFAKKMPSTPDAKQAILADLAEAAKEPYVDAIIANDPLDITIKEWKALNP